MFVGVDHVGVVVKDLDAAVKFYSEVLGFKLESVHILTEQKVKIAFLSCGGDTRIELIEPLGGDTLPANFLETCGEGIHHVAIRVRGIESILEDFKRKGVFFFDEKPRIGVKDEKIAFINPKNTHGVILELVEKP
ncbi:MAG: methylmalonyl-CoA epimerase [Candidatus Bathyarchaeia archaeon]